LIGIWQHKKILSKHFCSWLEFQPYLLLPNWR
jgi:hypothetical protein